LGWVGPEKEKEGGPRGGGRSMPPGWARVREARGRGFLVRFYFYFYFSNHFCFASLFLNRFEKSFEFQNLLNLNLNQRWE
jgi:hypothetical protein